MKTIGTSVDTNSLIIDKKRPINSSSPNKEISLSKVFYSHSPSQININKSELLNQLHHTKVKPSNHHGGKAASKNIKKSRFQVQKLSIVKIPNR